MSNQKDKETCIVVQGPIYNIDSLISIYKNSNYKIIISSSILPDDHIKIFKDNLFEVSVNGYASYQGRANFNNQVRNTYKGLLIANQLNYKYALKIRSDIYIDEIDKLISLFNKDRIYFPAYHNYDGGYLCDHMLFGDTNFLINLWNIEESYSMLPPETQLTNKFFSIRNNEKIDYIFPILFKNKILTQWPKHNLNINSYEYDSLYCYPEI